MDGISRPQLLLRSKRPVVRNRFAMDTGMIEHRNKGRGYENVVNRRHGAIADVVRKRRTRHRKEREWDTNLGNPIQQTSTRVVEVTHEDKRERLKTVAEKDELRSELGLGVSAQASDTAREVHTANDAVAQQRLARQAREHKEGRGTGTNFSNSDALTDQEGNARRSVTAADCGVLEGRVTIGAQAPPVRVAACLLQREHSHTGCA
jgi:hypothetical protein